MNAVPASNVTPAPSRTFDQITQQLTALSEASSGCQQVLAQNRTLREWVSARLREAINQAGHQTGLAVSNPDAIFRNRLADEGSITFSGMTDLLIDAVRDGASIDERFEGVFYTRHATLDDAYALTPDQNQGMKHVLEALAPAVVEGYGVYLRERWQEMIAYPGDSARIGRADDILVELHREALTRELELRVLCRALSAPQQSRLSSIIIDGTLAGAYGVSLKRPNAQPGVQLPIYIVSQSTEATDAPSGSVFLVVPCKGIEAFESVDVLFETLSHRLSTEARDPHLAAIMPLSIQKQLAQGETLSADAWKFEPLAQPLLEAHMQAVQTKQAQDLAFLLEQDQDQEPLDIIAWHKQVECIQSCAYLDDAMGHRFSLLSVRADAFFAPHWRKYANPADARHLLVLERAHRALDGEVAGRMAGVESFTAFAYNEVTAYIQRHLGCPIDPAGVTISLDDVIDLGSDDALTVKYEKTLFEFALSGLPQTRGSMSFAPLPNHLHTDFCEAFVRTLLADLNLHHRYGIALREAYENAENLRQLVKHRDSAIALSAFTATMQGHLRQDRSHELLNKIRGDESKEGSQYSIGSLYLLETHTRFNDFIVFEDKVGADEHFVLYAPGAPGGQDFFEFGSWRQLCLKVGGWLATEAGRTYVHAQLTGPAEKQHAAVINDIYLKPSLWGADSCLFVRSQKGTFESNLTDLISQKVSRTLQAAELAAPRTDSQTSFASPSIQAVIDARIEALNTEFKNISAGLIDYKSFVHAHTSSVLNQYLRDNAYTRHIDPDTLYLGLGQSYDDAPDFGEYTQLHQLTQLVMDGSEDILSHRPQTHLYSSTGVDVTALPVSVFHFMDKYIREADLGAKYMDMLEREFLGRQSPFYIRRKRLMAKRVQYEMSRSALKEFMRGQLSETQYAWLRKSILGLDRDAAIVSENTGVSAFTIADHIIEGVYIFRDFAKTDPEFNLIYTPDTPDGISFRPLTDYAQLLESSPMQNYYYSRVAYMGQPQVGTFFERLQRGGKFDEAFIRIPNRFENRIPDAEQLYGDMIERMIADVDAQTESLAEARFSAAWTVIQWLGTVLSIPFPLVSIGWGIFTSAVSVYQGLDAYLSGDRAAALPLLLEGVMGLLMAGSTARELFNATQLAAKGAGVPTGVWVWHKLESKAKFQEAVNEYLAETGASLIAE